MSLFEREEIEIHYEAQGEGFPVLAIAPGGMRSQIDAWSRSPWHPVERLVSEGYRVIAMDQRNAGDSFAPVSAQSGWDDYTADQVALLDHLGIERFAVVGMCIGGSYIAGLLRAVPTRVACALMMQPIGLENNREAFYTMFRGWVDEIRDRHPEADEIAWDRFRQNMFGGDFMFNATRDQIAAVDNPLLVLRGDDLHHPDATSRAVVELASNAQLVEHWKDEDHVEKADARIRAFFAEHAR